MPLYTPNAITLAPPDLAWDGDFWIERAVAHPALLMVPRRIEALGTRRPGLAGDWLAPPPCAMAAMWTRLWRLNAAISAAGVAFSAVDVDLVATSQNWTQALQFGLSSTYTDLQEGAAAPGDEPNWVQLSVTIGSSNLWHGWADGLWWPGLQVTVIARDFEADPPDDFTSASIGGTGDATGGASGVEVNCAGQSFTLLYNSDPGFALTGTVTLDPVEPLEIR